jgi:hypothetical protein
MLIPVKVACTKPENMKRFLDLFESSDFCVDRWHLDLSKAGTASHAKWQAVRPKGATYFAPQSVAKIAKGRRVPQASMTKLPLGHARLYFQHPSRNQSGGNFSSVKRSAPTLRYVHHMLAIMVGLL